MELRWDKIQRKKEFKDFNGLSGKEDLSEVYLTSAKDWQDMVNKVADGSLMMSCLAKVGDGKGHGQDTV